MNADRAWKIALIAAATLLSLAVAVATRAYVHPDERLHVEAFRYFAAHVWPPDLNSGALVYDPYGTSKVYSREIVYVLLGAPGAALGSLLGLSNPALAFRLLNVVLLPLALAALLWTRSALVPTAALTLAIASIPQVLYVFGYANSDGWAVFLSVVLFAQALRLAARPTPWPLHEAAALGALVGLLLASKDNFLIALAFPAIVLGGRLAAGLGRRGFLLFVVLCGLAPLPYKIVWPRTQADFSGATWRMSEERALPGFKPSDPSVAQPYRGDTATGLLLHSDFAVRTAQSTWGVYGHMSVFHAKAIYAGVALLGLANVALTLSTARRRWRDLPIERRRLLLAAPFVLLLNFALSLRWSADVFYQPQGRYLFPSLLAIALLLAGTLDFETHTRRLRQASAALAFGLAAWSLLFLAIPRLGGTRTAFDLGPEGVLEAAFILVLPFRIGWTLATRGFRRKLVVFPGVAATLGTAMIGAAAFIALASQSAPAWRGLAVLALLGLAIEAWRARPSFGKGDGLPPGSLTLAPTGPWVDPDFYFRQAERHGPVFKMSHLVDPQVCIVDLEAGRDFLRRNDAALEVPPLPFDRFVPGGFIRYMAPAPHRVRGASLRAAISTDVVAAGEPMVRDQVSAAVAEMRKDAGSRGPRAVLEPMAFRASCALFLGYAPGSEPQRRFEELMRTIDYRRALHVPAARVKAALHDALALLDATPPGGFFATLNAADPEAARDVGVRINFLYVFNTAWADVTGLLTWVTWWLATQPEWLLRLRTTDDAKALGERIVRESLRLSQSEYIVRRAKEPLEVGGYVVPKGWFVRVCIREIHRRAGTFADPTRFDPDRFLDPPGPNAYAPFGASRISCLGEPMTLLFGRTLASELARHDVAVVEDGPHELGPFHWQPSSRFRIRLASR